MYFCFCFLVGFWNSIGNVKNITKYKMILIIRTRQHIFEKKFKWNNISSKTIGKCSMMIYVLILEWATQILKRDIFSTCENWIKLKKKKLWTYFQMFFFFNLYGSIQQQMAKRPKKMIKIKANAVVWTFEKKICSCAQLYQ